MWPELAAMLPGTIFQLVDETEGDTSPATMYDLSSDGGASGGSCGELAAAAARGSSSVPCGTGVSIVSKLT